MEQPQQTDIYPELKSAIDPQPNTPIVIAGPCSAESEEQVMDTAKRLKHTGIKYFRAGVWKPRTHPGGFEGVGEKALCWLKRVKDELGMTVATEIASAAHANAAIEAGIDILWLGARTTTNPFLVQEIADVLKMHPETRLLVKNPANPDLELWIGAIQRFYNAGVYRISAVHRGFSAYGTHLYRNPPQWHIPIELHRRIPNLQIICDPSHIGGKRQLIAPLAQEALDLGFDGLIIESHCSPDNALSDSFQQITPEQLDKILSQLVIRKGAMPDNLLIQLRHQIDQIDDELLEIISRRMTIARHIGEYKKMNRMPIVQPERYDTLMQTRITQGTALGISYDFMQTLLTAIHEESVAQQLRIINP